MQRRECCSSAMTNEQFVEDLVATAIEATEGLSRAQEFRLRDLFPKDLWESFSKGTRIAAGGLFKDRADRMSGLQSLGRDGENHQRYRKL